MKIYVASSWRNTYQQGIVAKLRKLGHAVYDFRGGGDGWEDLRWAMADGTHLCGNCRRDHDEHLPDGNAYPKCPGGFSWKTVDPAWQTWPDDVNRYRAGLDHPFAVEGFNRDMDALKTANACLMVMPCGPSASMEMGWACGAGKMVAVYMPAIREPDLMVKMADLVTTEWSDIEGWLTKGVRAPTKLSFQERVEEWCLACFGQEITMSRGERNHRFIEEALELVQSLGYSREEAHRIVDYVFDRPTGEPSQELGGVVVTLNALATAFPMPVDYCGEKELARVWEKIDRIRAKQAAKPNSIRG